MKMKPAFSVSALFSPQKAYPYRQFVNSENRFPKTKKTYTLRFHVNRNASVALINGNRSAGFELTSNESVTNVWRKGIPKTSADEVSEVSINKSDFHWYNQWYPLAIIADLDKSRPTAITLLDINVVVWWARGPKHGKWAVLHDRCPHRHVALSEGRIDPESGQIECGYHGWQFEPSGRCSRIPQADKPSPELLPLATCASPLPSHVSGPLLFVWLGKTAPNAGDLPAVVTNSTRGRHVLSTYARTLPISFTTLMQNVLDPAHIHFAHHGQIGKRELATSIPIRMLSECSIDGFMADYYEGRVRVRFRPPALVEVVTTEGRAFGYYAVPIKYGLVRTIAVSAAAFRPWNEKFVRRPVWADHLRRNTLVEGDLALLQSQERLQSGITPHTSWQKYCMPTKSDRLVVELSKWLNRYAPVNESWYTENTSLDVSNIPQAASWSQKEAAKEKRESRTSLILETSSCAHRTIGHTMQCGRCSQVLRNIERLNDASAVGTLICLLITLLFSLYNTDRSSIFVSGSAICLSTSLLCQQWKKLF